MISRDAIDTLLTLSARPAISIFTPTGFTSTSGPSVRQNGIRLKNQLDEAEKRLAGMGWRKSRIDDLLHPAREVVDDDTFWADGHPGLAVFLAEGTEARLWRLPQGVEDLVVVGSHFHIAPLLPMAGGEEGFLVLAVSRSHTRMFHGDRFELREIDSRGLPENLERTVRDRTDYESNQSSNPVRSGRGGNGGKSRSVPESQGFGVSPDEERDIQFGHFLDLLATAFHKAWGDVRLPVVLAAGPDIAGHLRPNLRTPSVEPQVLEVNPDALSPAELHHRASDLLAPRREAAVEAVIDHFNSLYCDGSPRASVEPAEIVRAARWGRLDTLILGEGRHVWGRFDDQADRVETHDQPRELDDDLLDLAAQQTLLNGGAVRVVAPGEVPAGASCAAIMRY